MIELTEHAQKIFEHAKLRLKERYNIDYSLALQEEMNKDIKQRIERGKFTKQSCRIYLVQFKTLGIRFYCVYDVKRGIAITFLTKTMFHKRINSKRKKG